MTIQEIRNQAERLENYKLSKEEIQKSIWGGFKAILLIVFLVALKFLSIRYD